MTKYYYAYGMPANPQKVIDSFKFVGATQIEPQANCSNPDSIYFVDTDGVVKEAECGTTLYRMILEFGTRVFPKPDFKYAVGDKVCTKEGAICEVYRHLIFNGNPMYHLKKISHSIFKFSIIGPYHENDLNPYDELVIKSWEDMVKYEMPTPGWFINDEGEYIHESSGTASEAVPFKTKKLAEAAVAQSKIAFLMSSCVYGGEVTEDEWADSKKVKYIIERVQNEIQIIPVTIRYNFLAFHERSQAQIFLKNNKQLVQDYFMLD